MTERMKSRQLRDNLRRVLRYVEDDGRVVVEHYNRTVAQIVPASDDIVVLRAPDDTQAQRLRQLVAEHGTPGAPLGAGWRVVD